MKSVDFKKLRNEGKTVIYREEKEEINENGWRLWGKRKIKNEEAFVYRKIATFNEAEQCELEKEILT